MRVAVPDHFQPLDLDLSQQFVCPLLHPSPQRLTMSRLRTIEPSGVQPRKNTIPQTAPIDRELFGERSQEGLQVPVMTIGKLAKKLLHRKSGLPTVTQHENRLSMIGNGARACTSSAATKTGHDQPRIGFADTIKKIDLDDAQSNDGEKGEANKAFFVKNHNSSHGGDQLEREAAILPCSNDGCNQRNSQVKGKLLLLAGAA